MSERKYSVDRIYIAASGRDARLARICVASIRYFYPDVPIRLLAGDTLQAGLAEELQRYWGVELIDLPRGDYGWGLVKLEPLFGPVGERFLVLDADTVLTGPVLDRWAPSDAPFLVDDEDLPVADKKRLYYDWDKLRQIDPTLPVPTFLFNSGQWFGTAGLVARKEFDAVVDWQMPRRLRYPGEFMGGEQGVLNYVISRKAALEGLRVDRRTIMRWPGHSMEGLSAERISARTAPALVIHWAGMKTKRLTAMVGADILMHFEKFYYDRMPVASLRRPLATAYHVWLQWKYEVTVRLTLGYRKWIRGADLSRQA